MCQPNDTTIVISNLVHCTETPPCALYLIEYHQNCGVHCDVYHDALNVCLYFVVLKMWHSARQGTILKHSHVCKHNTCTLDLVWEQSLCLLCDPIHETFFVHSCCEPTM
jgi:hypothetical protein